MKKIILTFGHLLKYGGGLVEGQAVAQLAKVKPVFASLGNVAASGGYFLVAPAKQIFAQPSTITGSIGIFAGKVDLSGFLAKVGITVDVQRRGTRGDVDSLYRSYTPVERVALKRKLEHYYHRFLDAVAKGRKQLSTRAKVHAVARGRVWSGAQAKDRGLVDRLGGLHAAVEAARKAAGLYQGDGHEVLLLPRPGKSLISRALKLFLGSRAAAARLRAGSLAASPLLKRLLSPLAGLPPCLLLAKPDQPLARMPVEITIK